MNIALLSLLLGQTFTLDNGVVRVPEELFKMPVVVYVNAINEDSARQFDDDLRKAKNTGQPVIPVVIDSFGGSVYSMMGMCSSAKNIGVPVATIVKSKAMSAGAFLLSCGTEGMRYAAETATILVHNVSSGMEGKLPFLVIEVEETRRLDTLLFTTMARNVGKPDNFFIDLLKSKGGVDLYLSPTEAMEMGLVNHIKVPELKTKISLTTTFE